MTATEWLQENWDAHPDRESRIEACMAATGVCRDVAARRHKRIASGRQAPAAAPRARADAPTPTAGGFSLRGKELLIMRPQGTIKKRLYSLQRGMGYRVDDLAHEWHVTAETLRKHARDYDALRYIELAPGEYAACVVHPETIKEGQG